MKTPMYYKIRNTFFLVGLLTSLIVIGVIGFMVIEGFEFLQALYMTVITISTVGFGEIQKLSPSGMIFTIILIIISLGLFGFAISSITKDILDGVFKNYFISNKMKRKISKLSNHVIICGYGRVGKQVALDLTEHNETIVIIDNDDEEILNIQSKEGYLYINGDATLDEIMMLAQIKEAKALITTLPKDADNLFVVLSAKGLNPNLTIIARASEEHSDIKLKQAGATNVIMPDKIGGRRMAKLVAQPDIVEFVENILIQSSEDVNIAEISCNDISPEIAGKTIRELGIRNKSGTNIIGLKDENNNYIFNPSANVILKTSYQIFVLGTPQEVKDFKDYLHHPDL